MTTTSRARISMLALLAFLSPFVLPARTQAQAPVPAQSFLELQRTLSSGERVTVVDRQNRKATGRVVSVSGSQIEIMATRPTILGMPFAAGRLFAFTESDVRWIGHEDGTWNGRLIGAGLGIVAAGIIVAATDSQRAALSALIFLPPIGGAVGQNIDARHRRTLYRSPTATFTVTPLLRPGAAGIAAAIGF